MQVNEKELTYNRVFNYLINTKVLS